MRNYVDKQKLEECHEPDLAGLPGADIVLAGLRELRDGQPAECGLLVLIAQPHASPGWDCRYQLTK